MNVQECFEAGKLAEAIEASLAEVKQNPTDATRRAYLCDLLCYSGDLERADKQLDTMTLQDPEAVMGISLFRQLIRAEQARRDFYENGRVPEVLDDPTPMQQLELRAHIELREGNHSAAMDLLTEAEELRPPSKGTCDGVEFSEFRDLDDRASSSLEVYTPNGKYYWIPLERIDSIIFRPPQFPRDLMWRAARMVVQDGPEGEVYVPVLYCGSHASEENQIKLGRATDWIGEEGQPICGVGQRTFLVGEEDKPILSIANLQFEKVSA